MRQKFVSLVNKGQIEMVNGAWSMNDEACVNYQSTIDQFTWGLRYAISTPAFLFMKNDKIVSGSLTKPLVVVEYQESVGKSTPSDIVRNKRIFSLSWVLMESFLLD